MTPISVDNLAQMYLNWNWKANLAVIGQDGLPPCGIAGNVIWKGTKVACSIRLPPPIDASHVFETVK